MGNEKLEMRIEKKNGVGICVCPEIGEHFYYNNKRYICEKATEGCHGCDFVANIDTPDDFCYGMDCKYLERADRTSVIFRLQPEEGKEEEL